MVVMKTLMGRDDLQNATKCVKLMMQDFSFPLYPIIQMMVMQTLRWLAIGIILQILSQLITLYHNSVIQWKYKFWYFVSHQKSFQVSLVESSPNSMTVMVSPKKFRPDIMVSWYHGQPKKVRPGQVKLRSSGLPVVLACKEWGFIKSSFDLAMLPILTCS